MNRWLHHSRLAQMKNSHLIEAGYTIVELLIVLAVTTILLATFMISYAGQQGKAEFIQAVRNYETMLQKQIDEVSNGVYYTTSTCSASPGNNIPSIVAGFGPQSGTHDTCIFLGKLILTHESALNPGNKDEYDMILTVVGRRNSPSDENQIVKSYTEANPTTDQYVDEEFLRSYQLKVVKVLRLSDLSTQTAAFAFLNEVAGATGSNTQNVKLYGHSGTTVGSLNHVTQRINVNLENLIPLPEGILICLKGGNDQRAEIRIGGNNSNTLSILTKLNTPQTGVCA